MSHTSSSKAEGDVNAALNYFDYIPNTGEAALQDSTDYKVFTAPAES